MTGPHSCICGGAQGPHLRLGRLDRRPVGDHRRLGRLHLHEIADFLA